MFLAWGTGVLILVGAAATAGFALRYLVPLAAEFAVAGTLSDSRRWPAKRMAALSRMGSSFSTSLEMTVR